MPADRRLLLVHAHPDDETLTCGATMARYAAADMLEAADRPILVVRELRPQVVVTYDERGGYGHPDHVQAHRARMRGRWSWRTACGRSGKAAVPASAGSNTFG